jgi:ubiquinone/menaquinone biosynthesis C-methylase UbiE
MGHDIYYAQRLAEDTQFPDNHFDIIVTNLLFHEVESPAISKIVPEFHRIMRRGGIWDLTDGPGGPGHPKLSRPMTITTKAARWVNHRYNNETWEIEWAGVNMTKLVQDVGFHMDLDRTQMAPVKV